MQGTNQVYTKTVDAGVCVGATCKSTPTEVLSRLTYKWKVQAKVAGVWKSYSPLHDLYCRQRDHQTQGRLLAGS